MAAGEPIRNPVEWVVQQADAAGSAVRQAGQAAWNPEANPTTALPVRRIEIGDLWGVLGKGLSDLRAYRTDIIFLCIMYPLAGLLLARVAFDQNMLPLLFPLISGFALIGPVAAVGLYEISRRREQGVEISWGDAFGVVRAPAFGAILILGLSLFAIFLAWLAVAYLVYFVIIGPEPVTSAAEFFTNVLTTSTGWALIAVGVGVGFLFALLVFMISVVSFPMLLDQDVGVSAAVKTSVRAVMASPGPMIVWGLIVVGGLVIGSIPALLGLIIVMPLLGHATWHLYRAVVPRLPNARA